MPMLDGIEVNVIYVAPPILFVAYYVFPEPALPNRLLSSVVYGRIDPARNEILYIPPTPGEIRVPVRKAPNTMQMVGQHNNRLDLERAIGFDLAKRFPQEGNVPLVRKQSSPLMRYLR